jgi:hypothetical protein
MSFYILEFAITEICPRNFKILHLLNVKYQAFLYVSHAKLFKIDSGQLHVSAIFISAEILLPRFLIQLRPRGWGYA